MAFKGNFPKFFTLFLVTLCAIGLISCNPVPSDSLGAAAAAAGGSSGEDASNVGSGGIGLSARIDWSNPCGYPARNRTSRDIKKQHELLAQVNIAYNDYAETTAQDIVELYGNVSKSIQCSHKFLFGKSKTAKSNNSSNNNKKRLVNFYKELQVFGQRVEKVMDIDIDSADGVFAYGKRLEILSKMRDGAKRILCEMYDVLPDKNRRVKLRRSRQMDSNSIPEIANMTNTIAIDVCTFDSYKRMISSLGKFLNRKQDKSKKALQQLQQRRKHAAVRRSKDQKQPKNGSGINKRRRKQQQQKPQQQQQQHL